MAQNLTEQQENFAQLLFRGKGQSDAYLEAYPTSSKWNKSTLYANASRMAANSKVIARLEQLRAPVARKAQYDVNTAMDEAMQAFELAVEVRAPGAMVAAAQLRAKLQGLMIEKREISVTQMGSMTPTDKQMLLDAANKALAERKQLLAPDQGIEDVEPKGSTFDQK